MILALVGCLSYRFPEQDSPCIEVGLSIARRTYECTGDDALADERFHAFEQQVECRNTDAVLREHPGIGAADLYECSFAVGEVACEWVEAWGDDIPSWLAASDRCTWVVAP